METSIIDGVLSESFLDEAAEKLNASTSQVPSKPPRKRTPPIFKQKFTFHGFFWGYWGPWMITHQAKAFQAHGNIYNKYAWYPRRQPWYDKQIRLVQFFILIYLLLLYIFYCVMAIIRGIFFPKPKGLAKRKLKEVDEKWTIPFK